LRNSHINRSPHKNIKTSDASLKAVSEAISKKSKSLKCIELNFNGCFEITNKGLGYLVEKIEKNVKSLERVKLELRR